VVPFRDRLFEEPSVGEGVAEEGKNGRGWMWLCEIGTPNLTTGIVSSDWSSNKGLDSTN
jgi:hypothetical protein